MTAIRLIQKPVDGKITIDVPEDMRNETIVIELCSLRDMEQKKTLAEVSDNFFNKLRRPAPEFDWNSLNPYEQ